MANSETSDREGIPTHPEKAERLIFPECMCCHEKPTWIVEHKDYEIALCWPHALRHWLYYKKKYFRPGSTHGLIPYGR